MWKSAQLVTEGVATAEDGLHLSAVTLKHHVQVKIICFNIQGLYLIIFCFIDYFQMLMNMYCNERMNFKDGTCCRSPESASTLQIVTFTILLVW